VIAKWFPQPDVKPLSEKRYGVHFTIDEEAFQQLQHSKYLTKHRGEAGNIVTDDADRFDLNLAIPRRGLNPHRHGALKTLRGHERPPQPTVKVVFASVR
jgi:hypothetical protein